MPKVSKIYVGTNLVRPASSGLTETYNIQQVISTDGTTAKAWADIAKSGYNINKIELATTGTPRGSSYWGNLNMVLAYAQNTNPIYRIAIGTGYNNYGKIEYNLGNGTVNSHTFTGYSTSSVNDISFTLETTGGTITINGTTTTRTYTAEELTLISSLFSSSTSAIDIETTQGTNGPATITVTYEPI